MTERERYLVFLVERCKRRFSLIERASNDLTISSRKVCEALALNGTRDIEETLKINGLDNLNRRRHHENAQAALHL